MHTTAVHSPINSHEMMLSKSNFTFHFSRKNALKLASQMENWPMFSDAWYHHHRPRGYILGFIEIQGIPLKDN